jgi:hypothetical protein
MQQSLTNQIKLAECRCARRPILRHLERGNGLETHNRLPRGTKQSGQARQGSVGCGSCRVTGYILLHLFIGVRRAIFVSKCAARMSHSMMASLLQRTGLAPNLLPRVVRYSTIWYT